jgi:hypothetical protein
MSAASAPDRECIQSAWFAALGVMLAFAGCDAREHDAEDGDADGDADTDSDTDSDADGDTDSNTGSGNDTETQSSTDDWPTEGCVEQPDFTPCNVVTSPDRSYDICVNGKCVSPGCGDATCNVPGPHFPLPDTGQRDCYDGVGKIACPSDPAADFFGQDAQYGWDVAHESSERFSRDTSVSDEPVVTDNVTGLVWQGCAAGQIGSECGSYSASSYTWEKALAYCDALVWGGVHDWRLPDEYELQSIVNYGTLPAIDQTTFPLPYTNPPDDFPATFWSSSSSIYDASSGWYVEFEAGTAGAGIAKTAHAHMRCVRSGTTPESPRFTRAEPEADQPVVTDHVEGLEWQGCTAGQAGDSCELGSPDITLTWQKALAYCESLSWGGHADWRLPNTNELRSLVDNRRTYPAVNPVLFPATPSYREFWSSVSWTNLGFVASDAWVMGYWWGDLIHTGKNGANYVRCVRSAP